MFKILSRWGIFFFSIQYPLALTLFSIFNDSSDPRHLNLKIFFVDIYTKNPPPHFFFRIPTYYAPSSMCNLHF
jgi:hypothetical protein